MKVDECMCQDVCFVKPDCKVYDVARIMNENHIGCIPVCDDNKSIVGLITDRDIVLRTIACDKDYKNTPVSEVMTTDVCTCGCKEDVYQAQKTMSQNQIRRIPVVDNNKVIGILTLGDLAHYNEETGEDHFCNTVEDICGCGGQTKNNR